MCPMRDVQIERKTNGRRHTVFHDLQIPTAHSIHTNKPAPNWNPLGSIQLQTPMQAALDLPRHTNNMKRQRLQPYLERQLNKHPNWSKLHPMLCVLLPIVCLSPRKRNTQRIRWFRAMRLRFLQAAGPRSPVERSWPRRKE